MSDLVVARIGRPHGLRGEVTVQTHTDDPRARFVEGERFRTQAAPGSGVPRELTLASARVHRGVWLLSFAEVPDRGGAESLRGTRLLVPVAGTQTEEDEGWYEEELLGLTAYDPAGVVVGRVGGLRTGPAQDLLVLVLPDGHQAMVPFVESLVPVVDVPGGRVVVDPPPGLLDLGRPDSGSSDLGSSDLGPGDTGSRDTASGGS